MHVKPYYLNYSDRAARNRMANHYEDARRIDALVMEAAKPNTSDDRFAKIMKMVERLVERD